MPLDVALLRLHVIFLAWRKNLSTMTQTHLIIVSLSLKDYIAWRAGARAKKILIGQPPPLDLQRKLP